MLEVYATVQSVLTPTRLHYPARPVLLTVALLVYLTLAQAAKILGFTSVEVVSAPISPTSQMVIVSTVLQVADYAMLLAVARASPTTSCLALHASIAVLRHSWGYLEFVLTALPAVKPAALRPLAPSAALGSIFIEEHVSLPALTTPLQIILRRPANHVVHHAAPAPAVQSSVPPVSQDRDTFCKGHVFPHVQV